MFIVRRYNKRYDHEVVVCDLWMSCYKHMTSSRSGRVFLAKAKWNRTRMTLIGLISADKMYVD